MTTIVGQVCDLDYRQQGIDFDDCEYLFGKVHRSMLSLFQVITLDAWSEVIARQVIAGKPYLYFFFLVFLFCTTFGLLNIVVGVIVENTLHISDNNKKLQAQRQEARLRKELEALREVFEEADTDRSGGVDLEEFHEVMKREDVQQLFSEMELPFNEPDTLYEIFDVDKVGLLSIQRFVDGAIAFKGPPTGLEMRTMTLDVKGLTGKVQRIETALKAICAVGPSDVDSSSTHQISSSTQQGSLQRQHTQGSTGALSGGALSGPSEPLSPPVPPLVPPQPNFLKSHKHSASEAVERLDAIDQTLKAVWSDQESLSAEFQSLLRFAKPIAKRMGIEVTQDKRQSSGPSTNVRDAKLQDNPGINEMKLVNGVHDANGVHKVNLVNGVNTAQEAAGNSSTSQSSGANRSQRTTLELMRFIEGQNYALQLEMEKQDQLLRKSRPGSPATPYF